MNTLHRELKTTKNPAPALEPQDCYQCGRPVFYCRFPKRGRGGTRPISIEIAPKADGDIGISNDLFGGVPYAFELTTASSRYRLHGPTCPGPLSFSRFVGRKTK